MSKGTESTVLGSSGQISPAGQAGWLKSYVAASDTNHADISFKNGSSGSEKWADANIATTAEGDEAMRHTFSGRGLFFDKDIYLAMTNTPAASVEYEKA